MNKEIVVYVDSVGRKLMGVLVENDGVNIVVENPAIVNAAPTSDGQMSLQLIPEFFREVLADQNQSMRFTYPVASVALTNIKHVAKQVEIQYSAMFSPVTTVVDANDTASDTVVDLFGGEAGE